MSQPINNQYQTYPDPNISVKSGAPAINGQSGTTQHYQNGMQSEHYNSAGTPSSQSSRDPSRDASRDPSPTPYYPNDPYRSQLRRSQNGNQVDHNWRPRGPIATQDSAESSTSDSTNSSYYEKPGTYSSVSNTTQPEVEKLPTQTQVYNPIMPNSNQSDAWAGLDNKPHGVYSPQEPKPFEQSAPTSPPELKQPNNLADASRPPNFTNQPPLIRPQAQAPTAQFAKPPTNFQPPPTRPPMPMNQTGTPFVQSPTSAPSRTIGGAPLTSPPSGAPPAQSTPNYGSSQNIFGGAHNPATSTSNLFSGSQPNQFYNPSQELSGPKSASSPQYPSPSQKLQYPSFMSRPPMQQPLKPPTTQPTISQQPQISQQMNQQMQQHNLQPHLQPHLQPPAPPANSMYQNQQVPGARPNYPQYGSGSRPPLPGTINNQQYPPSQMSYPQSPYDAQQSPNTANMPPTVGQIKPPPPLGMPPVPGQNMQNQHEQRPQYPDQMSNVPLDNMTRRYPQAYPDQMSQLNNQMGGMSVTKHGFNKLLGMETVDLLQCRDILPADKVEAPKINLHHEFLDRVNCSPDIFRCTLTKIPETNSLLQKSRLPLGVLIHPFKDLSHLPVIHCATIVRCRVCRTYINPFVYFVDNKRWKCTICFRVNELPQEFQFDPVTKSYGDPSRRPEVRSSTIEFIAPAEYMLRPPQPAVYLFVLDVSRLAVESGYLTVVCNTLADELNKLPGDSRTKIGFLAVDSAIHFFSLPDNVSQPHEMVMLDVDDVFLPCPDNLIVNLKEREELIRDLLAQLPAKFQGTHDTNSALGAALQVAVKMMSPTGGRVTVFQTCLPNLGPGALQSREDPNTRSNKDVPHLNPATDFYKRLALDCSGQQIAMDLFLLNCQYSDLSTLAGVSKFSGGCIYHIPLFQISKPQHSDTLERMLRRYLTRKVGFEAVMRIRCTRGLTIHTFHGNFFVRSADLLSLPNINPDAGFGMQVAIDENLTDTQSVCFQAALLYTSSKGERRIRVHTLCIPIANTLPDILYSADQQCIIGLLAKMAVDKSQQSSLSDARDALINAAIDVLSAFKLTKSSSAGGILAPDNLKLLPLYIVALMKHTAFRSGINTRLDDRVYAMCQLKSLPLSHLMQSVYPDLYPVHVLDDRNVKEVDGKMCPQPPRLRLSAEKLDSQGAFLLDTGDKILIYVGKNVHPSFCNNVLGVPSFSAIPEEMYALPEIATSESEKLRNFVFSLQEEKPYYASLQIIRDDSHFRTLFTERLIEDRFESALSYFEFLQHLKTQLK